MDSLTEKQAAIIEVMRREDRVMFSEEILEFLDATLFTSGVRSVTPIMTGLAGRGLVQSSKGQKERVTKDGRTTSRELTMYELTDAGRELEYEIKASKK